MQTAKRSTSSDDDENDLDEDDEDDDEELDVDGSSPTRFVASNVQKKGENVYVVQVQTPITSGAAVRGLGILFPSNYPFNLLPYSRLVEFDLANELR